MRVTEEFDVARDLLGGVRDYYQAKITEGQNEVAKKLTVIASLVLVPSLIVGFYGQNFADQFRDRYWSAGRLGGADHRDDPSCSSRSSAGAAGSDAATARGRPPVATVPSVRVSAPAHTRTPSDESVAAAGRSVAVLDRALPFLGPALAAALGLVALGRRALVVDEASLLAAAQGSFSDVVGQAISDDPAGRATSRSCSRASLGDSELRLRLPSVIAGVAAAAAAPCSAAGWPDAMPALPHRSCSPRRWASSSHARRRPAAFALAAMLVSSALFARAVDRGNAFWWAAYTLSAVLLPLTHPIAVSALAAQLVAAAFAWRALDRRTRAAGTRHRGRRMRPPPRRGGGRPRRRA